MRYWKAGAEVFGTAANSQFRVASSSGSTSLGCTDSATYRLSAKDDETGTDLWAAVPPGAFVTAGFDDVANKLVRYETVVNADTEFSGPITASLRFSSSEIDSHVVARLGRIDKAGVYHALSRGTIRAALRKICFFVRIGLRSRPRPDWNGRIE